MDKRRENIGDWIRILFEAPSIQWRSQKIYTCGAKLTGSQIFSELHGIFQDYNRNHGARHGAARA